jgi:hypothetical protein
VLDDFEAYIRQFPQGRFVDLAKIRKDRLATATKTPVAATPTAIEVKPPTQLATPSDSSRPTIATPNIIKAPTALAVEASDASRPNQGVAQLPKADPEKVPAKVSEAGLYGRSANFEIELKPAGSSLDVITFVDKTTQRSFRCGVFFSRLTVNQDKEIERTSCPISSEPPRPVVPGLILKEIVITGNFSLLTVQYANSSNILMEKPEIIRLIRSDLKPQFEQAAKANPALTTEVFLQKTTTAAK